MEPKALATKLSNNKVTHAVQNLRPAKLDEEPPTGPAMGTLSPALAGRVREFGRK